MQDNGGNLANFIIGGTEKAGTTSVFVYLSQHPEVCASSKKETDFFRDQYCDDLLKDSANYGAYFKHAEPGHNVFMEASPSYLGEAGLVAERMNTLVPEAKLLFILRNPIDRMYSSYNFHVGKLNIPEDMEFSEYIRLCQSYSARSQTAAELGMDDWYLKVLEFGRYADSLSIFQKHFPPEQIKVMFFESLKKDEQGFMQELSEFLGINTDFWNDYEFRASNVTFSGKNKLLHRMAMWANTITEPLLRQRPELKHKLVDFYKSINQARQGYDPMAIEDKTALANYYAASIQDLAAMTGSEVPREWLSEDG